MRSSLCDIIDHSDYKNNGMMTKIWGHPGWIFNHSVTYGYPINPTPEQKLAYKIHFLNMGNILPCKYCRESYTKFVTEGETKLDDDALSCRKSLTTWFKKIHDAVNNKLEIDYAINMEDLDERYESFRAKCGKSTNTTTGCVVPLHQKAFSFKKLYSLEAPIVKLDVADVFFMLAAMRGLPEENFIMVETFYLYEGNFDRLKKLDYWSKRDDYCQEQIKFMRINGIGSIETDGEFEGLPTVDELKLLLMLSSNLNRSEVSEARNKLGKYFVKKIEIKNSIL